jgi:hypothetical protein
MTATVLVGFADSLALPEAVFDLLAHGFKVKLLARRGRLPSICRALGGVEPVYIASPDRDAGAAQTELLEAFRRHKDIGVFLAIDDQALWLSGAVAERMPAAVKIAHASGPRLELAMDKEKQIALARDCGFALLPTVIVPDGKQPPLDGPFPMIVRPARAVESDGQKLVKPAPLYLSNGGPRADWPQGPAMVQPLMHGTGEGIFGFATAAGVKAWSAHSRVRMMNPHGSGASACRSKLPDPDLKRMAESFAVRAGWRGPFMIELLRGRDGTAFFVEFNGRLWGSLALARRAGFAYAAWAAKQALDPAFEPPPVEPRAGIFVRHLGRDILHMMFVFRGPKSEFHRERWPGALKSIWAVLQPHWPSQHYNYDPAHRLYFLRNAIGTVAATLRKQK